MNRCLDSPFSVLDKPDPLSQCVSHVPFVKSACKLTFSGVFLPTCSEHAYFGPDNSMSSLSRYVCSQIPRCCTCLVRAAKPFLSGSREKVPEDTSSLSSLRPVGLALWLGKWESLMFQLRGLHSVLANLHPMMVIARHNRLSVSVGHQSHVFPLWPWRNPVMFARMLALLCTNVLKKTRV